MDEDPRVHRNAAIGWFSVLVIFGMLKLFVLSRRRKMSVSSMDLYRMAIKSGMTDAQAVKFAQEASGKCHSHREAESLVSSAAKALGLTVAVGVGVGLATAEIADDLLLNIPSTVAGTVIGGILDVFDF